MALLFCDSFDHYATAEIAQKWTALQNGVAWSSGTINAANGRNGTQSFRVTYSNTNSTGGYLRKTLSAVSGTTAIMGFGFKIDALPGAASRTPLVSILDGATEQVSLDINPAGTLSLYRGTAAGTLLGTSVTALSINTYYYIELKTVIHATTGTYEIRVNSTNVLSGTGANTAASGVAQWTGVQIGRNYSGSGAATIQDYDDLYTCDGSGATNTDFLGPIRVKAIYADGAGASTDFTPSAGLNFQNVDEALTDGDTTYNSESTAGDHDTYTFAAIGLTGTVKGVQTNLMVRSDGAGAETIAPMIRISTTDYQGTTVGITTSYADSMQVYAVSPATAAAWTVSEIDGAEFGIKLVA